MVDLDLIKKLREETGCGVIEAKKVLEETASYEEAKEVLKKRGIEKVAKKEARETAQGFVGSYLHSNGALASLVSLACETDFVARTEDFKRLANEVAMQVAAMNPASVEELLSQEYIREPNKTVRDLLVELSAKVGENVLVKDFKRLEVGA